MNAAGKWKITARTPVGDLDWVLTIEKAADSFTGVLDMVESQVPLEEGKVDGDQLTWQSTLQKPRVLRFSGRATVDRDAISGEIVMGIYGTRPFSGSRVI
ncbi:hypothetical protein [Streptomyces sp. NPDC048516]|uniref:hypothetical protein n=1 Tax=Streptomyces sp. NPDC048516 TaxID=3365565 RepID=UPI0037118736